MDYVTKWVEARPCRGVNESDIIQFWKEMIIHRNGIPPLIMVDHGSAFNGSRVWTFAEDCGIKILNSTPYYAQANEQVESTNKII